jgi:hypothetical protein
MNRTIFVLALAALSCAGCRAMSPYGGGGMGCGDACCEPCGPGPGCGDPCGPQCNGRGGSLDQCCAGGGDCAVFGRYCGPQCGCNNGGCGNCLNGGSYHGPCAGVGPGMGCGCCSSNCCGDGYPNAQYDCSACGSCGWGANGGYRHPNGYVTGQECHCDTGCRPPGPALNGCCCGHGYCCECCCGPPAPGCCNSGDQNYNFNPGPPVAQTAYPYYTLRGPRDFLLDNPPSIGPY